MGKTFCFGIFVNRSVKMMKFVTSCLLLSAGSAQRERRQSEFRLEHGSFIPKSIKTFSPYRDNVVTMVALKLKGDGYRSKSLRHALEAVFTHGCHCSWNKGRHSLTDKSIAGIDESDAACLSFEHCAECLAMDGCDIEAEFSPEVTKEGFTCQHLIGDSCKYNACLCSENLAQKLHSLFDGANFKEFSFSDFMDKCAHEVDASINTQMTEIGTDNRSEYKSERQCCASYPKRRAFTHKPTIGMACCNNKDIFNQKSQHCCSSGVQSLGDVCWDN